VSFARPYLYGLAAGGEEGVMLALRLLEQAVRRDMALAGVRSLGEIDRSLVQRRVADGPLK
jgi:L-lactate dehydrogenase (cytochrome)